MRWKSASRPALSSEQPVQMPPRCAGEPAGGFRQTVASGIVKRKEEPEPLRVICSFLLVAVLPVWSQSERITGPRALGILADRLQAAWARPVTYEEPLWVHLSDISTEGDPVLHTNGPRFRTVTLPVAALANRDKVRHVAHAREIVAGFNRDNAPLEFAVTESKWGLHLIPVRNKDRNGVPQATTTVLDDLVVVPVENRSPFGHLTALAQALSRKAGLHVAASTAVQGFAFDNLFAPADSPHQIAWGTAGSVKGRDALLDLLQRSATTYSWRLNCQPATAGSTAAFCVLNVGPIRLDVGAANGQSTPKILEWDRCVRCKPLRPPPPPR